MPVPVLVLILVPVPVLVLILVPVLVIVPVLTCVVLVLILLCLYLFLCSCLCLSCLCQLCLHCPGSHVRHNADPSTGTRRRKKSSYFLCLRLFVSSQFTRTFSCAYACACVVPIHTYDITTQAQAPEEESSFFLRFCRPSSHVLLLVLMLVPVPVLVPVLSRFTRTT